jgi:hypothetical protein
LENLPVEFCYRAAAANAGNRVSTQVVMEALHDQHEVSSLVDNSYIPLEEFDEYIENMEYDSEVSVKDISDFSDVLAESIVSTKYKTNSKTHDQLSSDRLSVTQLKSTSKKIGAIEKIKESRSLSKDNKNWVSFSTNVRETLPSGSPSRFQPPGTIDLAFQTKLAKSLPLRTLIMRHDASKDFNPQSSWISDMNENDEFDGEDSSLPNLANLDIT